MTALEKMKLQAKEFNELKAAAIKNGTYYVNYNGQNFYYWGGSWHNNKPSGYFAKCEPNFDNVNVGGASSNQHKAWIKALNEEGEEYGRWFYFPLEEETIREDMDILGKQSFWIAEWTLPAELEKWTDLQEANRLYERIIGKQ